MCYTTVPAAVMVRQGSKLSLSRWFLCALAAISLPAQARAGDGTACTAAVAIAARTRAVPPPVLHAIAAVESGRPIGRRLVPWPWSANVDGVGHWFATKDEAIASVREWRAAGRRSIDVGCMQINLQAHPAAFTTLDDAFDPAANAAYAASFLAALTRQTGRLDRAMTAYHSQTKLRADAYARRLLAVWPGAAALGLTAEPAPDPVQPTPSAYTPGFARRLARDRAGMPQQFLPGQSALRLVSEHGAAWPGR